MFSFKKACAMLITVGSTCFALEKPNILVIWGDDIGVHNISAYNHGIMATKLQILIELQIKVLSLQMLWRTIMHCW